MKKPFRLLSLLIVLALAGYYIFTHRNDLVVLQHISAVHILLLFGIHLFFFYVTGYTFNLLVRLHQIHLTHTETIGLSVLSTFANYFGPTGPGVGIKAVYMKASRGLAYSRFTSVLLANVFIALLMMGGTGLILLILLQQDGIGVPPFLFMICLSLISGALLPFVLSTPRIGRQGRIRQFLHHTLEGFNLIRPQKKLLLMICVLFLAQFAVAAIFSMVAYSAIGSPVSFHIALAIGIFTSIANLISLTPNSIGIQEVVTAYIFSLSGMEFSQGIIGAGIGRVVHLLMTFSLAPVFSWRLIKPYAQDSSSWRLLSRDIVHNNHN